MNLITGWAKTEYDQMGLWPGDAHYERRYDILSEYATIIRQLWTEGRSDFKGEFFTMNDCRLSPRPSAHVPVVSAGQSPRGMEFAAEFADFNFCVASGMNTPAAYAPTNERLLAASAKAGRDIGSYPLFMVIADESDDAASAKWEHYVEGADTEALAYLGFQADSDVKADANSTARWMARAASAMNFNMGTLVGSYAMSRVCWTRRRPCRVPRLMLTFDDFVVGMDQFGQRIQPLMASRGHVRQAA